MTPDASIVIISFNTKDLLRDCLHTAIAQSEGVRIEILVVDNASRDGSADMVRQEFPGVKLIRSEVNLGFAGANNRAFEQAAGRYIVLLNSDAFLRPGALSYAVQEMDRHPKTGLAGGRLVGRDDSWQPSARQFPSVLNEFLSLSGLSAKRPRSRFFGKVDRTWADPMLAAEVDWVPGAFSIIRREALEKAGYFDENFFLYYEEVDLCRRLKEKGYGIQYWPDIVVTHLGGESSKTVTSLTMSKSGAQLTLWRMRSELLYYRKHHGIAVWAVRALEQIWHGLRAVKNAGTGKAEDARRLVELMSCAWRDTAGGRVSPPRPW